MVISKRMPILDSIYSVVDSMTIVNGYNNDWSVAKSLNNGYSAVFDSAFLNVSFGQESPSGEAGQSIYHLTAPVYITGYKNYDMSLDLSYEDYEVQKAHSSIIEDIRFAFGLASDGMCSAGVTNWSYIDELDDYDFSACRVSAKMEFEIKWRDKRI